MDRRDKQRFAVPASPVSWSGSNTRGRPVSTNTGPSTTTSRSRSGGASVEDPDYRRLLLKNNIDLRPDYLPMPGHVESIVEHVRTRQRDSPERTDEELVYDEKRWELFEGTGEDEVVKYYSKHVFPDEDGNNDVLRVRTGKSMARQVVPFAGGDVAPFCVPAPDMLYGYRADRAFPNPAHREKLSGDMEKEVIAINDIGSRNALLYPFFIVEYKGVGGNMWVATNQCLGGTSACISIAEKLNRRLFEAAHAKDGVVTTVDSTAFSIAMNGNEARMYVSWKQDELNYYTTNIDCYALRRPDEYRRFRRMVRNVVDWGRNDRLKGIKKGLDQLLEAAEKQTPDIPDPALSGIPGSSGQSVRQRSPPSPSDKGSSSRRSKKQRS
ncbi:hypothetical protein Sste5346_006415 [Sporothrix stenoceras]|uniref:DUF7924 domain-containing protein n=1 Tax=Sporothrix stenoceras TaxID=5173 RepID=A0ABR3Z246_9PEZI